MRLVFHTLFFLFFSLSSYANNRVTAEVSSNSVSIEDELELTVTVEGTSNASEPTLPQLSGFSVISTGTTSNFEMINTDVRIKKIYSYVLIPQSVGQFTIGPIKVRIADKDHFTNQIEISVSSSQTRPSHPQSSSNSQAESAPDFWIETVVDKEKVLVNEQILYTFKFITKVNVDGASLTLPEFNGFWSEEISDDKKYYTQINGDQYLVNERHLALYPIKPGNIVISPAMLRVEYRGGGNIDPFFGFSRPKFKNKNLTSQPIDVFVETLPTPIPANFCGMVGKLELQSSVDPTQLKVGDSASQKIIFSGIGNIKDINLKDPSDNPDYKVYADKPQVSEKNKTGMRTKVFSYALVPLNPGNITITPVTVSYYDTEVRDYKQIGTNSGILSVSGNVTQPDSENLTRKAPILEHKLEFITGDSTSSAKNISPLVIIFGSLLPVIVFLILKFRDSGLTWLKRSNPLKLIIRDLKLYTHSKLSEKRLMNQFQKSFGEIMNQKSSALTASDIITYLTNRNLVTPQLQQFVLGLESSIYTGIKPTFEIDKLISELKSIGKTT